MDLSIRKYIYAFLAFVCVMLSAASCVYDDDYDTEDFEKEALQFRVLASDTKLTYNDLSTSFENDDVVGCVIASNNGGSYTFQTNTKWKYKDGVLMLVDDAAGHIQKWKDDSDTDKTEEMQSKGYVQLLGNYTYAFFFYYPYVETLDNTYPNSYNNPLAAQLAQNNWTSYPMFVHTDYDASGSNTKTLLNRTDHLWVGYTADNGNPINKENANHPVDLTFKKKTATIEIHCDIADGYSIENVSVSSIEKGIVRGVKLDLSNGSQSFYSADDYTTQAQNDLYTGNFIPGLIKTTEGKEKVYRMMLPAQTISEWNLNATLNGPSIEYGPKSYSIPLQEKLSVLKEGELYILHIAKAGHGYIIINDWNNGGASDLIEDQTMPENLSLSSTTDRDETKGILVKAGETLVVTGQNLDYAASLRLEGVYKLDDAFYEVADDYSQITITVPPTAKDGDVYLVTSSGIAVSAGTYVLVKPVATEVSSNSVRPGEPLTITGTDLDLVTKVVFGGDVAADVEVNAEGTSLTVTVPDMAVTGTISFMLANGTTVPCDDLGTITIVEPKVDNISAPKGKFKAKATITISGSNLDLATGVRIKWEETVKEVEYSKVDVSTLTFIMPDEALDGSVYVIARSGAEIHAGDYTLVKSAATSYSPSEVEAGDALVITGTDLDLVKTVTFVGSSTPVEPSAKDETSLTVRVPDDGKTGALTLTLLNGTAVTCPELTFAQPSVTSMTGTREKVDDKPVFKAGETVTLKGEYLNLLKSIKLNGTEVQSSSFALSGSKGDMTLTFSMPETAKDGSASYVPKSGSETAIGEYVLVKPVVNDGGYTPEVVEPGNDLVITGTDLDLVKTVTFVGSSTPVEPSAKDETSLTVRVPDDGKTGALTLTLLNGTAVTCPELTFAQPSVTSMTGTREKVDDKPVFKAGETVTLAGDNLHLIKSIKLENAEVTAFTVSDDKKTLTFAMPATAKDGTASYVSKSGDVVTIGDYVLVKPVVTPGTPVSAEPGQTLELTGTDMDLVTGVKFYNNVDPSESPTITETAITVKVPDNASTGTLNLNLDNGTSVGIQLTVNKVSGCSVSTVKEDNDNNGVHEVRENGTITVTGNNLEFAKSVKIVDEGGATHTVEVTDADLADGLSFVLPSGVTSAGTIYLVNQYGYEVQAGKYEMAFPTGVSSLLSPIKAGTTVTITGTDMDLVSSVKFHNNVTPAEEPVINETEISVKVPDTAIEGSISLVTKYGKTIDVSYSLVKPVFARYSTTDTDPTEKAFVGESLIINGSDMDLVTGVTFTGSSTPVVPDEGARTESSITVVVPAEAKTGQIYLNLANGTSVLCPELTIDYPWCYITDDLNAMEIYSGSTIEVNVANGSALTGVQVNGSPVNYNLTDPVLSIEMPDDAINETTIVLISEGVGEATYTIYCKPIETVLVDLGYDFDWATYDLNKLTEDVLSSITCFRLYVVSYNDSSYFDLWNSTTWISLTSRIYPKDAVVNGYIDINVSAIRETLKQMKNNNHQLAFDAKNGLKLSRITYY